MTRLLFFVLIPLFASAQIIDFPDSNFKNALLNTPCALVEGSDEFMDADIDNDGEIDMDEAASIWQLNVSGQGISSLDGIEHFVGLWILDCSSNNLSELTLNLPQLKIFSCRDNPLTTLNVF